MAQTSDGPLYLRQASFTVQVQGAADVTAGAPPDFGWSLIPPAGSLRGVPSRKYDGLHIRFKVEMHLQNAPNTLELVIYNLARTTRGQLQAPNAYVTLRAGYAKDGPYPPVVFQGNSRTIEHARVGPDWETRIQCGDGESAYRFSVCNQSWGPGVSASVIATYLAQQIAKGDVDPVTGNSRIDIRPFLARVAIPFPQPGSLAYPLQVFVFGFALQGNAFEELARFLGIGYTLSIQNGQLLALAAFEGTRLSVPLLSPGTGLLDSPDHGAPNFTSAPPLLKVRCLLDPRIAAGDFIQIKSQNQAGLFRVSSANHTGDLGGNDWFTTMECSPVSSPKLASGAPLVVPIPAGRV